MDNIKVLPAYAGMILLGLGEASSHEGCSPRMRG